LATKACLGLDRILSLKDFWSRSIFSTFEKPAAEVLLSKALIKVGHSSGFPFNVGKSYGSICRAERCWAHCRGCPCHVEIMLARKNIIFLFNIYLLSFSQGGQAQPLRLFALSSRTQEKWYQVLQLSHWTHIMSFPGRSFLKAPPTEVSSPRGKWRYASSKAKRKWSQYMIMWTVDRFKRYGR